MKSETTITALGLTMLVIGFSFFVTLGLIWATGLISSSVDSRALQALDERLGKLEAELPALRAEIAANTKLLEWVAEQRRLDREQEAAVRELRELESQLDQPQTRDGR